MSLQSPLFLDRKARFKISAIALKIIVERHRNNLQNDGFLQQKEKKIVSQFLFIPYDLNSFEGTVQLTGIVRLCLTHIKIPASQRKASK